MLMLWLSVFTSILIILLVFSFIIVNSNYVSAGLILNLKTSIWGCENSFEIIHCDLFKNAIEGTETTQKSKLINNITREPFYVDGKFGKAIEFIDKYGEYIEIPKKDIYNSPQFSISFWVKKTNGTDQLNAHAHIISFTSFDEKNGWAFDTNSSQDQSIRFIVSNKNGDAITSNSMPISNSTFTHIVATFDGSNIGLFKNGNLYEMIKYNGNYSSARNLPIHIGSAAYCDSCLQFKGIVDDFRLYNRAISLNEIKQLYFDAYKNVINNDKLSINRGLIGHWTFDNTLNDSSSTKIPGLMFTLMTSMVTAPDGRIFVSEKNTGQVKIMKDEKMLNEPFAVINDSYVSWEQGLLGLALDPQFAENHFVYLYYTAINSDDNPVNRVVRFTDKENVGFNPTVILDNIPASYGYHSGGAMAFGPDNKLYITIGDATEHLYSQSKSVLLGKILKLIVMVAFQKTIHFQILQFIP